MTTLRPAAQYLRMSTEQQTYSLVYQEAAIADFAERSGYELVRTYVDAGLSGLTLTARPGLRQLLSDVVAGACGFEAILVYDVSRWGRFQDPDQAAHYEFLCREAGVRIEYCAESFAGDGSLSATLMKHIRRTMAAEFSRDLSDKITRAKRGLSLDGFWPGGNPPMGYRRRAIAPGGEVRGDLGPGYRNGVKGDRITLTRGPRAEIALVRAIFRLGATPGQTPNGIAKILNLHGRKTLEGKSWTQQSVRRVLRNELYMGVRVVGRARVSLGRCKRRPEDEWTRVPAGAPPLVTAAQFEAVQRNIPRRCDRTTAQLIAELRAVYAQTGYLSHSLIARHPDLASPSTYVYRFGSLSGAYAQVGYQPSGEQARLWEQLAPHRVCGRAANDSPFTDEEVLERLRALRAREGYLTQELIAVTPGLPRKSNLVHRFGSVAAMYALAGHTITPRQADSIGRRRPRTRTAQVGPPESGAVTER